MPKIIRIILLMLFIVVSGAAFPIYNCGKSYGHALTGIILFLNVTCYLELGVFEKRILKIQKFFYAVLMNVGIIGAGLGCRYLLEWGEMSNVYNFTLPNILIHISITLAISTLSYLFAKDNA